MQRKLPMKSLRAFFITLLEMHTPTKEKIVRANNAPFMNKLCQKLLRLDQGCGINLSEIQQRKMKHTSKNIETIARDFLRKKRNAFITRVTLKHLQTIGCSGKL